MYMYMMAVPLCPCAVCSGVRLACIMAQRLVIALPCLT